MSLPKPHPVRDALLAISTLTALPVRATWPADESTDAPGYYPVVGAALGAAAFAVARVSELLGWSTRAPLVVAAGLIAWFAAATRMLHWDGLADVADALGGAERKRRLEIMKDSATGAFGVTAVVLAVVLQAASISLLLKGDRAWVLIAVPALGRLAATFAAWLGRPAQTDGLGASVIGRPRIGALLPALLAIAAVCGASVALLGVTGLWLCASGVALALAVPHAVSRPFGGVTGDVMGASVVLVETALFAALAVTLG